MVRLVDSLCDSSTLSLGVQSSIMDFIGNFLIRALVTQSKLILSHKAISIAVLVFTKFILFLRLIFFVIINKGINLKDNESQRYFKNVSLIK